MEALTFDKMPEAVAQILQRLEGIEKTLQKGNESSGPVIDRFFNPDEAAKFLNISKARVYTKHSNSLLPGCKIGNRLFFREMDLIDLMKAGRKRTFAEIALEADSYLAKNNKGGSSK